ncbi:MAG: hypothetical protein H6742_15860 [Alphaproteobacteria bacterium]|nr:hypothetical protein [Alphaproteobacteria bacterium]
MPGREAEPQGEDLRRGIRLLLADRHAPEAREMYLRIAKYVHQRVQRRCTGRYAGVLGSAEQEELVGEVLYQLIGGALARFQGETVASLLAFVRTVTDRTVGHAARARIRERDTLDSDAAREIEDWSAELPSPERCVHVVPDSPFDDKDEQYLEELFAAGTKAELARTQGVSRAAVTQRVQRIRTRIERMEPHEQQRAEAWLEHLARRSSRGELDAGPTDA